MSTEKPISLKSESVSSSLTLLLKIVFPTLWLTFFGLLTIAVLFSEETGLGVFGMGTAKYVLPMVLLSGGIFFYFTIMDLKKVELGKDHIYITNYFKTYRYSFESLKEVNELDWGIVHFISFKFHSKTQFGKSIFFLGSKNKWPDVLSRTPNFTNQFINKEEV